MYTLINFDKAIAPQDVRMFAKQPVHMVFMSQTLSAAIFLSKYKKLISTLSFIALEHSLPVIFCSHD
jgi:hypothetical protein